MPISSEEDHTSISKTSLLLFSEGFITPEIRAIAKMQFDLIALLMLSLAALNVAAPVAAPNADADAGNSVLGCTQLS